jgi:hypothetical protein
MDHKERESKANLAPVREFIRRVFRDMQQIPQGRNPGRGKLPIRVPNPTEWICRDRRPE